MENVKGMAMWIARGDGVGFSYGLWGVDKRVEMWIKIA